MNRSTLARHRLGRLARFRRDPNEGGGGGQNGGSAGEGGSGGSDGSGGSGGSGGASGAGNNGSGTGTGAGESDKGFPENTAVAEMNDKQQAAYWRYHSKKHEQRANSRADYDQVAERAKKYDELVASQATDQEKAVNAAREEGRTEATRIANESAVKAILRGALASKGKTGDELTTLVGAANPAAFITDGQPDADKVTAYAASIAGTGTGTGGADTGQGRRNQSTGSGLASGRERYEARRGKKATAGK